jgi:hypothetical protein
MQSDTSIGLELADPIAVLMAERSLQRRICDDLELLADQLGGSLDVGLCAFLKAQLQGDLQIYHRNEEYLFDLLTVGEPANGMLAACAELAASQHAAMQSYVYELLEPLTDLSMGVRPGNLDTVGYMLRCCFDGMRHHLQWEDVSLLSAAALSPTAMDLHRLRQAIISNRA